MSFRDNARFYTINGMQYPSVTTILGVIDKSAPLMHWAVNQERKAFEAALLDVLSHDGARDPSYVLDRMATAISGQKAMLKEKDKAASIGTAAHALIEWHTRRMLGEDPGPEPKVPDAAAWAVEAWKDWAKAVDFTPLCAERVVYCEECGYAGTLDWIARVDGVLSLGDYKTAKAIYPEAFLQNRAYRHAAVKVGLSETVQGIVLRLPKTVDDPAFEAMVVPETPLEDFLSALRLWRWQRRMDGKSTGRGRSAAVAS